MMKYVRTIILTLMMLQLTACYYDNQVDLHPGSVALPCDSSDYSYTGKISSILQTNCYSCHSQSFAAANVRLDNYAGVKVVVDNGSLLGSINHQAGFTPMPQNLPKLSDCDRNLIKKWIDNGSSSN